jgi:glycosidase
MRQLVVEYDADAAGDVALRAARGRFPVLDVLVKAYSYLMARYDFDGFRIDSVKYVDPRMVESFGNAMREFAFSIGKKNFFTFGEIYDGEQTIAEFVGRNSGDTDGYGIDAALDFPLFFQIGNVVKGLAPVEQIAQVFDVRKTVEAELLSSHGEAGQFFVSFLDNHDQSQRIRAPGTPTEQVTMALALLFTLQGIPCVYYGTEQELEGTSPPAQYEGVREALWGKASAFDQTGATFTSLKQLAALRSGDAALRFGRLYFRETAGDGINFGRPKGPNGIVAYSRILAGREVLVVANCQGDAAAPPWRGFVLLDRDLNRAPQRYTVAYSNRGTVGGGDSLTIPNAVFWDANNQPGAPGPVAAAFVILAPREVQILTT